MAQIPSGLVSHSRKICNFYKRVIRFTESRYELLSYYRYESVLIRAEFDKNKNIKDLRIAKQLLQKGEEKLLLSDRSDLSSELKIFINSPRGIAFEREHIPPDWLLDFWHPMEKAMYPKYFAKREQRKKEYEEFYKKEYGKMLIKPDED